MNLELFLKTVIWLPIFVLAGYAIPQFLFETNQFYGFIGMFGGLFAWLLIFIINYVKSGE